jgi:hypothetical protein
VPPNWDDVIGGTAALRRLDKDEVKAGLPLEWVFQREGLILEPDSTGLRLIGPCPFHNDTSQNFAVYGDNFDHAGCWACSFNGDIFDVIAHYHPCDFKGALQLAGQMLEDFRADPAWRPRAQVQPSRPKANPADLTSRALAAWNAAHQSPEAIDRLINEKQRDDPGWAKITTKYLIERWTIGIESDSVVVVPHFSVREETGDAVLCHAIKTRTARSHLYATSGSDLGDMYGAHLDQGRDQVVICEGESDTWCTDVEVGQEADVLGVPSGAGTPARPQWIPRFRNRHVVIAFDGDRAGRTAAERWHTALLSTAASVRVCVLPDGQDMATALAIRKVLAAAVEVRPSVGQVAPAPGGLAFYVRKSGDDAIPICNWVMQPERELSCADGSRAYEGTVNRQDVVLQSFHCASNQKIIDWSIAAGGNWRGMTRDAQDLLGHLESRGPFLARGHATGVAGWHDGNFVWPGGRLGMDYWRYIKPLAAVPMPKLKIEQGPWNPKCVKLMQSLHSHDVTSPILAWLAIAPVRSMLETFPFLAVVGSSGSGKTTLIETILDTFGWNISSTLTATTPHAVHSLVGATNGLPVWFDEYRPGAREDSLAVMQQVLRDAYDATPSMKGGAQDNRQALTSMPTEAPIIVTGEDAFSETSHIERAILLNLPSRGKSAKALKELKELGKYNGGFGYAYLEWLIESWRRGTLPAIKVDRTAGRVPANLATLYVGWSLLRQFYAETTGEDLGEPDFRRIEHGIAEAASTDPITDALAWVRYSTFPSGQIVWPEGDDIMVKVADFVREVQRSGQFKLPGNRTAIAKYLDEHWGARQETHPVYGRIRRLVGQGERLSRQD